MDSYTEISQRKNGDGCETTITNGDFHLVDWELVEGTVEDRFVDLDSLTEVKRIVDVL